MSDITEAVGTAAEGGLFARAFGGKGGGLTDKNGDPLERGHFSEGSCLNCGAKLVGTHCHDCGQKAHLHRTIGGFAHDLLHGALHLDGKVWRTLPMLIRKPGELTRRYIEGERARFVSPMAMFLFSVFLMFAVFQAVGLTAPTDLPGDAREQVKNIVEAEQTRIDKRIAELDEQLTAENLGERSRASLERQRAELVDERELLGGDVAGIADWIASKGSDTATDLKLTGKAQIDDAKVRLANMPEGSSERADLAAEIAMAESGMEQLEQVEQVAAGAIALNDDGSARMTMEKSGVPFIDEAVKKWRKNPGLMLYKLQANGYKFSWLLIPLSIPFVWLIFAWKRRFRAYDHAIFVTYSLAFMSLLFILLSVLSAGGIGGGWVFLGLAIIPPIHMYKHLRHAYGIGRFSALWRLAALLFFIIIVLGLFLQLLLLIGAF